MRTECSADLFDFAPVEGRGVVAGFDGGAITSDAGALLLAATDRAIRLVDGFADCFHGYYDCYCYLPLYVFCSEQLLAAKLRPANIDGSAGAVEEVARIIAQIRVRWPHTRIILRADSGFAREVLMAWCEANGVSTTSLVLPRTSASSARSGPSLLRRGRRAAPAVNRHGGSTSWCGRRGRAGAGRGASSPRRSGPKARVSERMCKQVSVSLPKMGDSHDDQFDNYTGVT
jgi:hypothetical protein